MSPPAEVAGFELAVVPDPAAGAVVALDVAFLLELHPAPTNTRASEPAINLRQRR
jgi:hypothetical protein